MIAIGKSKLSDTSVIASPAGAVALTLERQDEHHVERRLLGRRLGRRDRGRRRSITDSEAFVDSTAATPVTAHEPDDLRRHRQHGADDGASRARRARPENDQRREQPRAAANGNSQTSDGNQNLTAALARHRARRDDAGLHRAEQRERRSRDHAGAGAQTIHAGASKKTSAIADGGNVKFSPDAPTLTASAGGSLADNKTYFYKVTAVLGLRREPPEPGGAARDPERLRQQDDQPQLDGRPRRDRLQDLPQRGDRRGEAARRRVGAVTAFTDDGSRRSARTRRRPPSRTPASASPSRSTSPT